MATKVIYKQGTKSTYLSLLTKDPNALYFCTDTRELYKGPDLYSDGLRFIESANLLPDPLQAANGVIYFCLNSGNGYVLNDEHTAWVQVVSAPDNKTIEINTDGLLAVKKIEIARVDGLSDRLEDIEKRIDSGVAPSSVDPATHDTAGIVKPSEEFSLAADGSMSINAVDAQKITGLEQLLAAALDTQLSWQDMGSN